jgi:hypothetical protein
MTPILLGIPLPLGKLTDYVVWAAPDPLRTERKRRIQWETTTKRTHGRAHRHAAPRNFPEGRDTLNSDAPLGKPGKFWPINGIHTQQELAALFQMRGPFLCDHNNVIAGRLVGNLGRVVALEGYEYPAQDIAWCLQTGAWPHSPLTHIGALGDNRRENLQETQ